MQTPIITPAGTVALAPGFAISMAASNAGTSCSLTVVWAERSRA